jgi:transitional endoplasmic reticulum ATPase
MNVLIRFCSFIWDELLQPVIYWIALLSCIAIGASVFFGLVQAIPEKKHLADLTFTISPSTTEASILLGASAYLAFLHVIKYISVALKGEDREFSPNEGLTSLLIGISTPSITIGSGLVLVAWAFAGQKSPDTSFLSIIVLSIAILLSFMQYTTGWNYGQGIKKDTSPRYASKQQSQAPLIKNYTPSEERPPVARVEKPKITYANIQGNTDIKRRLLAAAKAIASQDSENGPEQRNGILLHGEPGNGKTIFAEALAGEMGLRIFKLTHSDVASKWVGDRTEKIVSVFNWAKRAQPCVLFIDEIDSFLADRSGSQGRNKEDDDVVNSLLTLLVDIRQHRVIVMAATNYVDRLDGAAIREGRFDFKVEITPPDEQARIGLLTAGLAKNLKSISASPQTIQVVAQRWNGFSVKRILAVTEELPSYLAERQEGGTRKTSLEYEDFMAALRRIQGRKGSSPENVKPMSELILPEVTKEALEMLSSRLRDPQRVERMGGSLPTGVLFFGPPGTGKTAACKALAKEVDWAFLIATGTDLARDPKELDKLYTKAKELRPCIIFIDEADDLVRSREHSNNTESTNKLLTLMDGVNDRIRDVVWIAATNHPDNIDQALLRGGRFTEKVEFVRPEESQMVIHVDKWLKARKIRLEPAFTAQELAEAVGDESIANLEAVLQYAVNRAISKTTLDYVVLSKEDAARGISSVLGKHVEFAETTAGTDYTDATFHEPEPEPEFQAGPELPSGPEPTIHAVANSEPATAREAFHAPQAPQPKPARPAARRKQPLPPIPVTQTRPTGLKVMTLSDHTQDMVNKEASGRMRDYQAKQQRYDSALEARDRTKERYRADLSRAWEQKDKVGLLKGTWNTLFGTLPEVPNAPTLAPASDEERVWASGNEGEEAVTAVLSAQLYDNWTLLRGYHGARGEIDLMLVGSQGCVAIEVKNIKGLVKCYGDSWTRDKYDNFGNLKETNIAISDNKGRGPSRQLNESADFLQAHLKKTFPNLHIRRAVILSHEKSKLGTVSAPTVDYISTLSDLHVPSLTHGPIISPDEATRLIDAIRRDHLYHANWRAS